MIKKLLIICMILSTAALYAVDLDSAGRDTEYVNVIKARAKKIVDKLELEDKVAEDVTNIVANRYFRLNDIYDKRDTQVKEIKDSEIVKDLKNHKIQAVQNEKDAALFKHHFEFASALSLFLNAEQIEAVKDGMTYGVVMVTYNSTLDMIPSLTDEEKAQILAWLKEAREFAMDAESSHKKHEAFGKYKGRINNYLSKRGYDLTKEREEWYKRIEMRKQEERNRN